MPDVSRESAHLPSSPATPTRSVAGEVKSEGRYDYVCRLPDPGRTLTITVDREHRQRCEGSNLTALDRGHLFGTCPVCKGQLVIVDEDNGRLWTHTRVGIRIAADESPFPLMSILKRRAR